VAASFTIPTYFTAIDKISPAIRTMNDSVAGFANKAEASISRAERGFRKMTPAIGEAGKQMLSMFGTAALVGGAFAGAAFSVKSIMEYETELANLKALTGTTGKEFDTFKEKIRQVSVQTGSSSVEVTKAFTAIANNRKVVSDKL